MPVIAKDLIVNRNDLSEAEFTTTEFPDGAPEGHCLLKIDQFALTANNITYGVAGDMLGYWSFFPTAKDGFGRIPVWGFADVVASSIPEVEVGRRVYGYLPMSTHVMIRPGQITGASMMDTADTRKDRAPIYNQYSFVDRDPAWSPEAEGMISLFRPLFTTSFLLDDMHRESDYFDADAVVLSSASSKTALGLAFLLSRSPTRPVRVVGLTSAANRAFVESLGVYSDVVTYDALGQLPKGTAAYVDMAGDTDLRVKVHEHFRDNLKNSCAVGITHWQGRHSDSPEMPGPRPAFFFAPSYAQDRLKAWGPAGFQSRLGEAWQAFLDAATAWIAVTHDVGPEAAMARYQQVLNGQSNPAEGHILSL